MRDTPVRPLTLILLLALSLSLPVAFAQDAGNETTGDGAPATNETGEAAANETTAGNETGEEPAEPEAPAGPVEIVMTAHQEGSSFYFMAEGYEGRNPTLNVPPGVEVTIQLTSASGFHNIQVDGFPASDYVQDGDTVTYTFTAPESGSLQYWCVPHKGSGMVGDIRFGTAAGGGGGAPADGGEDGITGDAIDLGQFDPACEGQRAPAIVTRDIVGGPTLQDYIDRCSQSQTQGGETHPADYVIPLSFALIGLGIVGMVWVHKYYKP